ncbi:bifunctional phosphoribosylaminoimidazolecarboxamide formyltransferase/IMP cyclohydrolase [Thermocrinis minervae]|uniref:Bifunctional purine biosynthesis protein PurH n=1 Tax=Thermocrinis minervae TaxID=381751 RepID=A0A1M6SSV8_9AQUI|nr:bifunctional phosphoribosylaminoimidazolecarboxamide formyltransferase/IMP cyclohydrolase [Thermocrinis minervae]SHK47746.1 phosphoribosylaminoimidazolecarboxamide formyltransferase / IMP cyclohydrolase [Thermocrinis minervae]
MRRALISVYYKEGVEEIAKALESAGYEIVSTGKTATYLQELGISVKKIEDITGFPEILGGRVKTLHPLIHGGILLREWVEEDLKQSKELGIVPIDVVVVNLYPFEEKLKEGLEERELLEFIDIGGPTLLRASAKNFYRVVVVVDPQDYGWVSQKIREGGLTLEERRRLAAKAFAYTSYYDALVWNYLWKEEGFPNFFSLPFKNLRSLRYGENPHQKGFLLENPLESLGIVKAKILQGKEMSFNNYLDADAAVRSVSELQGPACVIVKHNNPCGAAVGSDLLDAFLKAKETDPESAFGGIVAFNDIVDARLAQELTEMFLEVVIAPEYEPQALEILSRKKNLRVIQYFGHSIWYDIKKVSGGYLMQEEDTELYRELKVVTKREPTEEELKDLIFAYKVCKHVKSNAVVIAKGERTLAIGSGNTSRVDSLRCAISRAHRYGFNLEGAVLASEAFFPFRDSVDIAASVGIRAIIQPGGSIRDKEVIEAADEHHIAMIFTGTRHFKH